MRRLCRLLALPIFLVSCAVKQEPSLGAGGKQANQTEPSRTKLAEEWVSAVLDRLLKAETLQWEVRREIVGSLGVEDFRFQLHGRSRFHFTQRQGEDFLEGWYEGSDLWLGRSGSGDLIQIPLGESEAEYLARSVMSGGTIGWEMFQVLETGGLEIDDISLAGEAELNGRSCVILSHGFKLGGVCGTWREFEGCRVWIDKQQCVVLRREYRLVSKGGKPGEPVIGVETYSGWTFDAPLDDSVFHTKGMNPPDPSAKLPDDPEQYEIVQTKRALGIDVRDFSGNQGISGFDDLPADATPTEVELTARSPTAEGPKNFEQRQDWSSARASDGETYWALMTWADQNQGRLTPDHGFNSDVKTRRHRYGEGAYHPYDIFLGKKQGDMLKPTLQFRDVGSHANQAPAFAVDARGRCHLLVPDVDMGQKNRFKLLWVIGDLNTGKWTEACLIEHRRLFTSSAAAQVVTAGEKTEAFWSWGGRDNPSEEGVFTVPLGAEGFGRKKRIFALPCDFIERFSAAVQPGTGTALVGVDSYHGKSQFALVARDGAGRWHAPKVVDLGLTFVGAFEVQCGPDDTFVLRMTTEETHEWVVKVK